MLAPPPALATVTVGRLGTGPPRTASFFPAHCKVLKKTERKEGPSTAMTLGPQPTAICSGANVSDGVSFFLVVLSYGGGGGENRRRAELRDCAYPEEPAWELECDFRFVRVGLSGLSCTKTAFTAVQYAGSELVSLDHLSSPSQKNLLAAVVPSQLATSPGPGVARLIFWYLGGGSSINNPTPGAAPAAGQWLGPGRPGGNTH